MSSQVRAQGLDFLVRVAILFVLAVYFLLPAHGQEAAPAPAASAPAQAAPATAAAPEVSPAVTAALDAQIAEARRLALEKGVDEEQIRKRLLGRRFYLRGFYLDNDLSFNEHGGLVGHSPVGSFTLATVQIDKVSFSKHKVELEGARYAVHFLGGLPTEDDSKSFEMVRITPKKKTVHISIDRELVDLPSVGKLEKMKSRAVRDAQKKAEAGRKKGLPAAGPVDATTPPAEVAEGNAPAEQAPGQAPSPEPAQATASSTVPAAADPNSQTTTPSPAHAARTLDEALGNVFAEAVDDRMLATLPDFWKAYYRAKAEHRDYLPVANVVRASSGVVAPRLVSSLDPESNEFAQKNEIAGMAQYHAVIGADGRPREVSVSRPIGFGLDENAVAAIRRSTFVPGEVNGQKAPVMIDLVVTFRIFSKRTMGAPAAVSRATGGEADAPSTQTADAADSAASR